MKIISHIKIYIPILFFLVLFFLIPRLARAEYVLENSNTAPKECVDKFKEITGKKDTSIGVKFNCGNGYIQAVAINPDGSQTFKYFNPSSPPGCPDSPQEGPPSGVPCQGGGTSTNPTSGGTITAPLPNIPAHSAQSFTCKVLPESFCSASDDSGVYGLLSLVINILTGIIGLVVVAIIIISGIQLISSSGNPETVASAKKRIFNAVLGLVLLISMRAILALIGIKVV